jgi:hypothetical protein
MCTLWNMVTPDSNFVISISPMLQNWLAIGRREQLIPWRAARCPLATPESLRITDLFVGIFFRVILLFLCEILFNKN